MNTFNYKYHKSCFSSFFFFRSLPLKRNTLNETDILWAQIACFLLTDHFRINGHLIRIRNNRNPSSKRVQLCSIAISIDCSVCNIYALAIITGFFFSVFIRLFQLQFNITNKSQPPRRKSEQHDFHYGKSVRFMFLKIILIAMHKFGSR